MTDQKYKYSNFEVDVKHAKSVSIGERFNGKLYVRIELKDIDFGIANVDLCFDDIEKAKRWFENSFNYLKKFEDTK